MRVVIHALSSLSPLAFLLHVRRNRPAHRRRHRLFDEAGDLLTVFDYCFVPAKNDWQPWTDFTNAYEHQLIGDGPVWFVQGIDMPPLPLWLWQHAWPLMLALLLALAAWLWRRLPRPGPQWHAAEADRTDYLGHLLALERRRRLVAAAHQRAGHRARGRRV